MPVDSSYRGRTFVRRAPFILLLAFLAGLAAACGGASSEASGPPGQRDAESIPTVEAVQARSGALPLEHRFSGVVRADNQVAIFPEISASVVRVAVENGDYVRAGQPLVYLRDTQFREQLQQAEAALQMAQADARRAEAVLSESRTRLERTEELVSKQYQSRQDLQAVQAEVESAEAGVEQARARIAQAEATVAERSEALRQTIVRAPIAGHVGQRDVEVGMRVDNNTRLFIMGNLENVRVEIPVNDEMIGQIEQGQSALVAPESSSDQPIRGEVSRISPFLEAGSFSAEAEIDVENSDGRLRPGMFVNVDVHYGESQQATLVPLSALYENPQTGELGIFVATSLGTEIPVEVPEAFDPDNPPPVSEVTPTTFRAVTVLARGRETAGVQGVNPGEWVVTIGQNLLNESLEDRPPARIRVIPWDRIAVLQRMQDEDLLRDFMAKQQQLARSSGTAESRPDTSGSASDAATP